MFRTITTEEEWLLVPVIKVLRSESDNLPLKTTFTSLSLP